MGRQAFRYGLVGLASTGINYVLFTGGIAVGVYYLISATISSVVTVCIGYYLNRIYTFAVPRKATAAEFGSFLGVFAVQYFISMGGYALMIGWLEINPPLAFCINSVIIAGVAFTLLRYFTFSSI